MVEQLDFTKPYILEDNCVLLQPLTLENSIELLHFALNEPDIWKYSLVPMNGETNFYKYIHQAIDGKEQKNMYTFIVFDKQTKQFAGCTRFYDIQLAFKTLQLGYTWYGKNFQGTGLNKRCKFLLLQFAFETLEIERVEFRADNNNVKSIAAMKSIGCTVEGVLRSHLPIHPNGRRDSIILSILRDEWHSHVKQNLLHKINNL